MNYLSYMILSGYYEEHELLSWYEQGDISALQYIEHHSPGMSDRFKEWCHRHACTEDEAAAMDFWMNIMVYSLILRSFLRKSPIVLIMGCLRIGEKIPSCSMTFAVLMLHCISPFGVTEIPPLMISIAVPGF